MKIEMMSRQSLLRTKYCDQCSKWRARIIINDSAYCGYCENKMAYAGLKLAHKYDITYYLHVKEKIPFVPDYVKDQMRAHFNNNILKLWLVSRK